MKRIVDRYEQLLAQHSDWGFIVLRWGLGATMFLAGLHKLFAPEIWAGYFAPEFAAIWPIPPSVEMQFVDGPVEIVIGIALLGDYLTSVAAGLSAVALAGIVLNLMVAGTPVDVLIRDIGLFALAAGVALVAAGRQSE